MKDVLAIMFAQSAILMGITDFSHGLNPNGQYLLVISVWYLISWFLHFIFTRDF